MITVRNDLSTRKNEADKFIIYLHKLEDLEYPNTDTYFSLFPNLDIISLKTTMKASVCLILYNIVESTTTNCLRKIHETIISDRLYYSDLSVPIQKILLTYYEHSLVKISDIGKIVDQKYNQIELVENRVYFDISFSELSQYYQMYSGNLDGKQIKSILNRYGITYEAQCSELQTIKNNRNKLAHGEMSFEEIGRDLSVQQIEHYKVKVFDFLEGMISKVEEYLASKEYTIAGH